MHGLHEGTPMSRGLGFIFLRLFRCQMQEAQEPRISEARCPNLLRLFATSLGSTAGVDHALDGLGRLRPEYEPRTA